MIQGTVDSVILNERWRSAIELNLRTQRSAMDCLFCWSFVASSISNHNSFQRRWFKCEINCLIFCGQFYSVLNPIINPSAEKFRWTEGAIHGVTLVRLTNEKLLANDGDEYQWISFNSRIFSYFIYRLCERGKHGDYVFILWYKYRSFLAQKLLSNNTLFTTKSTPQSFSLY